MKKKSLLGQRRLDENLKPSNYRLLQKMGDKIVLKRNGICAYSHYCFFLSSSQKKKDKAWIVAMGKWSPFRAKVFFSSLYKQPPWNYTDDPSMHTCMLSDLIKEVSHSRQINLVRIVCCRVEIAV